MEICMGGFLIPVTKDRLSKYRKTAQKAGELFVSHYATSLEDLTFIDQQDTLNLFLAPATGDERTCHQSSKGLARTDPDHDCDRGF